MPQDGSNNYQYPPGTPGIPNQTIESEAYNTFLDDLVVNDLNIARPVHRGGTGGTTADEALTNLSAEKSSQLVSNFEAHVWMPGSFYAATTATGSPVAGHAFTGIAYSSDPVANPPANLNVVVEARDQSDSVVVGRLYVREKKAGIWSAWVEQAGGSAENGFRGAQQFIASGTFTQPTGANHVLVYVWGAGGGGHGSGINFPGGSGAGLAIKVIRNLTAGTNVTVTVAPISAPNANGGTSSFGTHCSATGGIGGTFDSSGNGIGGDINLRGGLGGVGLSGALTGTGGGAPLLATYGAGQSVQHGALNSGAGGTTGGPTTGGSGMVWVFYW